MTRQEQHYKIVNPNITIDRIKTILQDNNIKVVEVWAPVSYADTYSLRLYIEGTKLGVNGKGLTKEFAKASAYAELMERLQNCWLMRFSFRKKDLNFSDYYIEYDEKVMSIDEIALLDNSFLNMYYKSCGFINPSRDEMIECLKKTQLYECELTGEKNTYTMIPFTNVGTGVITYLPYNLYVNFYGSNGMCAGNCAEEAIIQGLSEVVERYIQKEVMTKHYSLPAIPDHYIQQFPEISSRMETLRQKKGYTFILKDCSLGGKYPVAALISIEMNSGNYGVKFGCHPDFGIAMERAITEATQGLNITEYAKKSRLNFNNDIVDNQYNISNSFKSGKGQYPYEILLNEPTFPFIPTKDMRNKDDTQLLHYMIDEVITDQYEIYIHDASILGFPAYQIIIPYFSEMNYLDFQAFSDLTLKLRIEEMLNNPALITKDNCKYLMYIMNKFSHDEMRNSMRDLMGTLYNNSILPGEDIYIGWLYTLIMCCIMQQDYEKAASYMKVFQSINRQNDSCNHNFYNGVAEYIHGMKVMKEHKKVITYLLQFFDKDICDKLDLIFNNSDNIFINHFPFHDHGNEDKCRENNCCDFYQYIDLIRLVKKTQEMNGFSQLVKKIAI